MKHEDDAELCSMEDMREFGVSKQIIEEIEERQNNWGIKTIMGTNANRGHERDEINEGETVEKLGFRYKEN